MASPPSAVAGSTLGPFRGRTAIWTIGALALFTSAAGLMEQSPWIDELHTLATARTGLWEGIVAHMRGNIPPGAAALEWLFTLGGRSLLGGRLLSAFAFSMAAVAFRASATRLLSARGALVASLAFATNPLLVWHAQDARPYALLVLFSTLSFLALLRTLAGEPRQAAWLLAWAVLGFSTHIYFGCFFAAMILHSLWHLREPAGRRVFTALAVACAPAAATVVVLAVMSHGRAAGFQKPVDLFALGYAGLVFGVGYSFGATSEELHSGRAVDAMRPYLPAAAVILIGFWGVVALGALLLRSERPARFYEWLGYLLLPLLLPFGVAIAMKSITFNVRYALPALPACFLLIGVVAERSTRAALITALPLAVQLWGLGAYHFDRRHWKEDFIALAAYLASHSTPADHIYECPTPTLAEILTPERRIGELTPGSLRDPVGATGAHAVYVFNRPWVCDPDGALRRALRSDATVTSADLHGFEVFRR